MYSFMFTFIGKLWLSLKCKRVKDVVVVADKISLHLYMFILFSAM